MSDALIHLYGLPVLQNRVYATPAAGRACPRGSVTLRQDPATGIVSNVDFDASLLRYDADYQNEQACSPSFRSHLDEVLRILGRHFRERQVLEVGCGKGFFLGLLRAAGYEAVGIDPAYEGDDPAVMRAPFSPALGMSAPSLVVRHVLEHIEDPLAFLETVAAANGGSGIIYIEVPCFDWICAHKAWFDIFYEHVNYFRPSDFRRCFGRVLEAGHLFGGQYQYVVADLASLRRPGDRGPDAVLPRDFMRGVERCVAAAGGSVARAIWGASSKGVLFAHHLSARGSPPDALIDINPVKQGRFAAGTGLPILEPEAAIRSLPAGSTVFVMNPNYFDEIARQAGGHFHLVNVDTL